MSTPLTDLTFNLLVVLSGEELHGYALVKRLRELEGYDSLRTGSLYAALARLLDDELIEEAPGPGLPADDDRRRYYRLSEGGRQAVRTEALRRDRLLGIAREKDLLSGREGG